MSKGTRAHEQEEDETMKSNEMIAEELGMTVEEFEAMIEEEAEKYELLTAMEHGIALF